MSGGSPPPRCGEPEQSPWIPWTPPYAQDPYMGSTPPMGAIRRPMAVVTPFDAGNERPLPANQMGPYPRCPIHMGATPPRAANRPVAVVSPYTVGRPATPPDPDSPTGDQRWRMPPIPSPPRINYDRWVDNFDYAHYDALLLEHARERAERERAGREHPIYPPHSGLADNFDYAHYDALLLELAREQAERERAGREHPIYPPHSGLDDEDDDEQLLMQSDEFPQAQFHPLNPRYAPNRSLDDENYEFADLGIMPFDQTQPGAGFQTPPGSATIHSPEEWLDEEPEPDWGALPSEEASPCGGLQDPAFPTEYSPIPPDPPRFATEYSPIPPSPRAFDDEDSPGQGWWRDDHIPFDVELSPQDGWWNARPEDGYEPRARRSLSFSGEASLCGGFQTPPGSATIHSPAEWLEDEPEPDWGALPSEEASPCGGLQDPAFPTEYSPIPPDPSRFATEYSPIPPSPRAFDEEDSPGQGWWRDDHIPFDVELSPQDGWWNARPEDGYEPRARRRLSFSGEASLCGGLQTPPGSATIHSPAEWLEDEPEPDWGALPSEEASPCGGLQDPAFPTEYSPIPPDPSRFATEYSPIPPSPRVFDEEDSPGQGWWRDDHVPFDVELSPRDGWWNAGPEDEYEPGARRSLSFC